MSFSKRVASNPIFLFLITMIFLCSVSTGTEIGEVLSQQKISDTAGNFNGELDDSDLFGCSVASLGDIDNDGNTDIAVGAYQDDDGGSNRGAVWILFLDSDGTVKSHQKISDTEGGFTGTLDNTDNFGCSVACLGDLDEDDIADVAVGAAEDDDGGTSRGAVWILFLNSDGTVKSHQKISDTAGNFDGVLDDSDLFGSSVTSIGDLDNDGVTDIAVGAIKDDDGGSNTGAVWILFLNSNGTVKSYSKISDTDGGFKGILDDIDSFGASVTSLGDLNKDDVLDIAVGASNDDDGGTNRGAIWILFLDSDGTVNAHQKISDAEGDFEGALDNYDFFGCSLASIGDFDRDGVADIAVGAIGDGDGGSDRGAVWILFLTSDGTVKSYQKISDTEGGFTGILDNSDNFGSSIAAVGDLDGDRSTDFAVGATGDDDGGTSRGAVWMLFLHSCTYDISGDIDRDCKVDLSDLALMSGNWLVDCEQTPDDPGCVPTE